MPTVETLFDFATPIEAAALAAIGPRAPSGTGLLSRACRPATPEIKTPRIEVAFATTGTLEHHQQARDGSWYRDCYTGTLTFVCTCLRKDGAQQPGALAGAVRAAMQSQADAFNAVSLPYHDVMFLEETASTPATDARDDEIILAIVFEIHVGVSENEWPPSGS
jgi:hypothetical protein